GGTASDNCGIDTYTCSDSPFVGNSCSGTILRTHCVTDASGSMACCGQIIEVHDTIPPTIKCPPDVSVQCLADGPPCPANLAAILAAGGMAMDNCDTDLTYFCIDGPLRNGTCGGVFARTHTVCDNCTNCASCVQIITINDTIPPVITCPPDQTNEWV